MISGHFHHHPSASNNMIFTITIEPDIKLVERLTFLQEDLGKIIAARNADSRWTRPEYLSVPLLCLGTHDRGAVPEFNEILRNVAKDIAQFQMTTAGISAFPTPECPRLIQVSAEPSHVLEDIRERLMEGFRAANIRFDSRPFKATMLLGRVATKQSRINLSDAMNAIQDLNFGQSDVFELVLMGSKLNESGPSHQVISRFPLKGGTN